MSTPTSNPRPSSTSYPSSLSFPIRRFTNPSATFPTTKGKCIRTASALIIGDEILNGRTMDRNSHYIAKYCFEYGIELKRIEVVADKEEEIVEASKRMVQDYDFVITTGGIGPTHDDITYAALAKAFNQRLIHHVETLYRMEEMYRHRSWVATQNPQQQEAFRRMALFPEHAEVLFVRQDLWVPVVRLQGKLHVFPGIPTLFQKMLDGLEPFLNLPPASERPLRIQIFTERPESIIAPYLTALQARLKPIDVQVGSYPVIGKGVCVSLIGRAKGPSGSRIDGQGNSEWLANLAREVEAEIDGHVVTEEEVARKKGEVPASLTSAAAAAAAVPAHQHQHQQVEHQQARRF